MSSTMEITAPTSTPLSSPAPSTPSSAVIATRNSPRCTCQSRSNSLLHEARDGHEHDRGEHGLRQIAQQVGEKKGDEQDENRAEQSGERRACAAAFIHERLRHAAADRKAVAEARGEICAGEREEFLVAVEPIAVLLGKHLADRRGLDGAEEKARERQWEQFAQVSQCTAGNDGIGRPRGTSPSSFTPCAPKSMNEAAAMPPITTNRATGLFGSSFFPRMSSPNAAQPSRSELVFVSPTWRKNTSMRSQKSPCPPFTPKSFGNCVLASCSATPALKPIMTLSETKFTAEPARASQAKNAIAAVSSAVQAASAPKRAGSPPAMLPSDEPMSSEIAEVTLIEVCRELQKSQNTSPPNRHA